MELEEIEIIKKEILNEYKIFLRYITFKCVCGNVWGVSTEWNENHAITKKDLVCRKCATEKVARNL